MIGAVENGLVAALVAAGTSGQLGYTWLTTDTYPDDFDAYLKEKGNLRMPACWAVFLGLSQGGDDQSGTGPEFDAKFAVIVAAQNLRNETATRHGTPGEPGSYQLAEDAARVLSRNGLGLDLSSPVSVNSIRLIARSPEVRTQRISLMALEVSCRFALGMLPGTDGNQADFTLLHNDWDVPPLGNVVPGPDGHLPATSADLADNVRLPQ